MFERNRAEGWQHAKLSGHKNEDLVTKLILEDTTIQQKLLLSASKKGNIVGVVEGGLCEKQIPSVLGDGTKAKPDIRLITDQNDHVNVSLKKSFGGQVFLITVDRFIKGFEMQYNTTVPDNVKLAISLFWGSSKLVPSIIDECAKVEISYQTRKHRLVKDTMDRYNSSLSKVLLNWFQDNIVEIFDFCFVKGLAKNSDDWADVIWYKNLLDGEEDGDTIINLDKLRIKIKENVDMICYGKLTGGSTIQLPFGFVQWHLGQMQFHHNLSTIKSIL
jgi:hypothetical protein